MAESDIKLSVTADTSPAFRQISDFARNVPTIRAKFEGFGGLGQISRDATQFQQSMASANSRVLAFGSSAGIIYGIVRAFREVVASTIDVQKRLVEINQTLNLSSTQLDKFSSNLFEAAKLTGQSFDTAAKAALEFGRQGLSVNETLKRTVDALTLTRISGLEVGKSITAITVAINGFNQVGLDSTKIINKLAEVDVNFAVSSKDLAEGLTRIGNVAQEAGVGINSLIGLITSAQTQTGRGGAIISNALKTIFQRIERPQVLDTLKELNIQVTDLAGNTLPADKILQNLAKSYGSLNGPSKQFVTQLSAGILQGNQFKAILSDLAKENSVYSRATATAANASDGAAKRQAELNKTLAASINEATVNVQQLAAGLGNLTIEPLIKTIVQDISGLTGAITDSLKSKDSLGGVIGSGLLSGLGSYLSGPGLALGIALFSKLFVNFANFAKTALASVLETTNNEYVSRAAINNLLAKSPQLYAEIAKGGLTELEIQDKILSSLSQELVLRNEISKIFPAAAALQAEGAIRVSQGQVKLGQKSRFGAVGIIPEMEERMGAYAGGYTPGIVKQLNIPKLGNVVYNTNEQIKKFPQFSQPAILPPVNSAAGLTYKGNFIKAHGFNPYMSKGFFPNFARSDDFLGELKNQSFPNIKYSATNNYFGKTLEEEVYLAQLEAIEKGKGSGNQFMQSIGGIADKHKIKLSLIPRAYKGGLPQDKLEQFYKKHGFETSATLPDSGEILEMIRNPAKNRGLIPNFNQTLGYNNPLSNAIEREKAAGIPESAIKISQSNALRNPQNPLGLGVFNDKDEPGGLVQGISRYSVMGLDPQKAGVYSRGKIPNFASDLPNDVTPLKNAFEAVLAKIDKFNVNTPLKSSVEIGQLKAESINKSIEALKNAALSLDANKIKVRQPQTTNLLNQGTNLQLGPSPLLSTSLVNDISKTIANAFKSVLPNLEKIGSNLPVSPIKPIISEVKTQLENLPSSKQKLRNLPDVPPNYVPNIPLPPGIDTPSFRRNNPERFSPPPTPDLPSNQYSNQFQRRGNALLLNPTGFEQKLFIPQIKSSEAPGADIRGLPKLNQDTTKFIEAIQKGQLDPKSENAKKLAEGLRAQAAALDHGTGLLNLLNKNLSDTIPLAELSRDGYKKQAEEIRKTTIETATQTRKASSLNPFVSVPASNKLKESGDFASLRDAANSRANKAFLASFLVPQGAGILAQTFGDKTVGQRGGAQLTSGLGNIASFGLTGVGLAPGVPLIGAGIGVGVGLLSELPKIFKAFSDVVPDIKRKLEELKETTQKATESIGGFIDTSEQLADILSGKVSGVTKGQVSQLQRQQLSLVGSIPSVSGRDTIRELVQNGQINQAREISGNLFQTLAGRQRILGFNAQFGNFKQGFLGGLGTEGLSKSDEEQVKEIQNLTAKLQKEQSKGSGRNQLFFAPNEKFSIQATPPKNEGIIQNLKSQIELKNKEFLNTSDFANELRSNQGALIGLTDTRGKRFGNLLERTDVTANLKGTPQQQATQIAKNIEDLGKSGKLDESAQALLKSFGDGIHNNLGIISQPVLNLLKSLVSPDAIKKLRENAEIFVSTNSKLGNSIYSIAKRIVEIQRNLEDSAVAINIAGIKQSSQLGTKLQTGEIQQSVGNQITLLSQGGEGLKNLFNTNDTLLAGQNRATLEKNDLTNNTKSSTVDALLNFNREFTAEIDKNSKQLFQGQPDLQSKAIENVKQDFDSTFGKIIENLKNGGTLNVEELRKQVVSKLGQTEKFQRLGGLPFAIEDINKQFDFGPFTKDDSAEKQKRIDALFKQYQTGPGGLTVEEIQNFLSKNADQQKFQQSHGKEAVDVTVKLQDTLNKILDNYSETTAKIDADLEKTKSGTLTQFAENNKLLGAQFANQSEVSRGGNVIETAGIRRQGNLDIKRLGLRLPESVVAQNQAQLEQTISSLFKERQGLPALQGLNLSSARFINPANNQINTKEIDNLVNSQKNTVLGNQSELNDLNKLKKQNGSLIDPDDIKRFQTLTNEVDTYRELYKLQQAITEETNKTVALNEKDLAAAKIKLAFSTDRANDIEQTNIRRAQTGQFDKIQSGQGFLSELQYNQNDFWKDMTTNIQSFGRDLKSAFKEGFAEAATGSKKFSDALRESALKYLNTIITKSTNQSIDVLFGLAEKGIRSITKPSDNSSADTVSTVGNILSSYFGSGKNQGGLVQKFSRGGIVRGGMGGVDDINAKLSDQEYVLKASSVKAIGVENLDYLNNLASGGPVKKPSGFNNLPVSDAFLDQVAKSNKNLRRFELPQKIQRDSAKTGNQSFSGTFANQLLFNNPRNPSSIRYNTSGFLSDFALTDDNNPANRRKFSLERDYLQRQIDKLAYQETIKEFDDLQKQKIYAAWISASIQIAGSTAGKGGTTGGSAGSSPNAPGGASTSYFSYRKDGGLMTKNFAQGGIAFGGDSSTDSIDARLSRDEFVVKSQVVKKLGVNFFNRLNNTGKIGFASGGLVPSPNYISPNIGNDQTANYLSQLVTLFQSVSDNLGKNPDSKEKQTNSAPNIYISTNVTLSSDGKTTSNTSVSGGSQKQDDKNNQGFDNDKAKALGNLITTKVKETLVNELRNGGILQSALKSK